MVTQTNTMVNTVPRSVQIQHTNYRIRDNFTAFFFVEREITGTCPTKGRTEFVTKRFVLLQMIINSQYSVREKQSSIRIW